MKMEEFLKTQLNVNLTELAKRMWPNNPSAKTYMSIKLSPSSTRPLTKKDAAKAKEILKEMYQDKLRKLEELED